MPTDFNGIPTVNSQRAFFFSWDDNGERINDLWEIFENVIQGKDISLLFDKVIADGVPKYSLTMVLYWISPFNYLNLDGRNRLFLKKYGLKDYKPSPKTLNGYGGSMNIYGITVDTPVSSYKAYCQQMARYEQEFKKLFSKV